MFDSTIVDDPPAPAEVLIHEARQRQRRRYRRSAILISVVALLVGALVAVLVTTISSGSGPSRSPSAPAAVMAGRSTVLIRPVLCYAYPFAPSKSVGGRLPACGAPYALTATALGVTPQSSPFGYSMGNVRADPALAGYPSSTRDVPGRTVLLSTSLPESGTGSQRYLLGPSEMRLSASDVSSTSAQRNQGGQWVVTIHLTSAGSVTWDRVAQQNFHQLLAIDLGGKVVSVPIIQPTQASFSSFDGAMQISGSINGSLARAVAAAARG
jgi:hypothetical protein